MELLSNRQQNTRAERVTLNDPNEGSPKQVIFRGLDQAGLSLLIYGPGDIRSCFTAVFTAAPAFRATEPVAESWYLGAFPGQREITWTAMTGPLGSAVAVHCYPHCDKHFTTTQIATCLVGPTGTLRQPWQFGIGTVGARVPIGFADVFAVAQAVPLGVLPGLERIPVPVA